MECFFIMLSAYPLKCMSPFLTCFPRLLSAKPFGWGHTRLSHIKRRRLIMPLVALVQKNRAHPQLRTLVWCSALPSSSPLLLALPSSSPLLLAFHLQSSECSYKNAPNRQNVKQIKSRGRPLLFLLSLRTPTCSSRCRCHSSS